MVVRYNIPYQFKVQSETKTYKKRYINRKTSNKDNIKALTPKNRQFLQSLGFKVLR